MDRGFDRRSAARVWAVVACAALLALVAPGCGGGDATFDREPSPKAVVVMGDGEYRPATVRVPVGGRVTWVNNSETANTVETSGVAFFEYDREKLDRQNRFDLHTLQPGEAESVEFDTPGTYEYRSSLDGEMKGTVRVVESDR